MIEDMGDRKFNDTVLYLLSDTFNPQDGIAADTLSIYRVGRIFEIIDQVGVQHFQWLFRFQQPQSGRESATTDDSTIMKVADDGKQQNIDFGDQHDPFMYSVDGVMDPTRKLMDTDDARLDNFITRPIKISEEEWGTGTNLFYDLDPWSLYLENPRVINRIANFNLLRCQLHLKIVINGNGFQYGRALASYLPFDQFDSLSTNRALVPQDLVQATQLPHVFLDPTTSTGAEMTLPFFEYKNYVGIPDSEWNQLGELVVRSINPLKHAN